eukprot:scaffold33110_cov24-Phaeocystis_antarctica.AAC.1
MPPPRALGPPRPRAVHAARTPHASRAARAAPLLELHALRTLRSRRHHNCKLGRGAEGVCVARTGGGPRDQSAAPKRLTCIEQAQANRERQHARSAAGRNNPSPRRAGRPERPPRCMDPPRCAGASVAAQEGRPDTLWW